MPGRAPAGRASAGQDTERDQNGQAGDQQEQAVLAHRRRCRMSRDKWLHAAVANHLKLIQPVRTPITIKIAKPTANRSRLLSFMTVDISDLR
jgi:hypothetical protein